MDADANANADVGGSTIALRERCSGEVKMMALCRFLTYCIWPKLYIVQSVRKFFKMSEKGQNFDKHTHQSVVNSYKINAHLLKQTVCTSKYIIKHTRA